MYTTKYYIAHLSAYTTSHLTIQNFIFNKMAVKFCFNKCHPPLYANANNTAITLTKECFEECYAQKRYHDLDCDPLVKPKP
uniref:Uncharacterized protein n=1 Tax=Strigamia maritima TaxID=126957 RepID=T1JNJ8_STRMM